MNYPYYAQHRSYFDHYESPNIVIVPTVHEINMAQNDNLVFNSATDPALVSEQIQPNFTVTETGADLMINNGYLNYGSNNTASLNHVVIQPASTLAADKNQEPINPFCSTSNSGIQNNLITLTGSNSKLPDKKLSTVDSVNINNGKSINIKETRDINNIAGSEHIKYPISSNSTNTKTKKEDYLKPSQSKAEKKYSYNSSKYYKRNYSDSKIKSNRQHLEKHRFDKEFKFKRTITSSETKKHTGTPEKLKTLQQEYASSSIEPRPDNLTKSHKQNLSPGAFKRYLDYQNFLRKFNTAQKIKETETTNSDRRMSSDTNKIASHSECDKKKKVLSSKLNNSVVSTKKDMSSSYFDQKLEKDKSNKKTKDNVINETNSNIKSKEKTSHCTELNKDENIKNKNDPKNSLYHDSKKTLIESNKIKAPSCEKEKRKRKSKEEPTSLELKKKKEDYKRTRSRITEFKKKKELSDKFAPFLELRKKKEEKRKKMDEESKNNHYKNIELKTKIFETNTQSSYTQNEEQREKNQQQKLQVKNFIRDEKDRFKKVSITNLAYTKKSREREERTKDMKGSSKFNPTVIKTKKFSPMKDTKKLTTNKETLLKTQSHNKREKFKAKTRISRSTQIETGHSHSSAIRNVDMDVDQTKHTFSSYKIEDKMDLRTMLIRKRAKNNAAKSKHFRTKTPERENIIITLQQDVTDNSKPTPMTHISGKSKVKKNKKVKLLISIACDSEESDNSGETANNYCSSPFEDLSFLDDLNVDEIVDSLTQKGSVTKENQNNVQRIQNMLKKDPAKRISLDEANGVEKKRRLLNIDSMHCDTIQMIQSSDDEKCTMEGKQVAQNKKDSTNANVNSTPTKIIDDDVYEVIDITDDFQNETIVIEHNVEELIEELFASPTKEDRNSKEIIDKRTANTLDDDSKRHTQNLNNVDFKPDLVDDIEQYITASELPILPLVMPLTETKKDNGIEETNLSQQKQQNIHKNDMKSQQHHEDYLQCKYNKNNIIHEESKHTIEYQNLATSKSDEKCVPFIETDVDAKSMDPKENGDSLLQSSNLGMVLNKQAELSFQFLTETTSGSEEPQNKLNDAKQSIDIGFNKQIELKLEPETTSSSEEPQNKLNDAKQSIDVGFNKQLELKLEPETTSGSEEPQNKLNNAKQNIDVGFYKQIELKLEPETTSSSEEPQNKLNDAKQSIDVGFNKQIELKLEPERTSGSEEPQNKLNGAKPCFQITKNNKDCVIFKETTESENVIEANPDIIHVELAADNKFVNKDLNTPSLKLPEKIKKQDNMMLNEEILSGPLQPHEKATDIKCVELSDNNKSVNKDSDDQILNLADSIAKPDNIILNLEGLSNIVQPQNNSKHATCSENVIITESIKCPQFYNKKAQNDVNSDVNTESVTLDNDTKNKSDKCEAVLADFSKIKRKTDMGTRDTTCKMAAANNMSGSGLPETSKTDVETTKNIENQSHSIENVNKDEFLHINTGNPKFNFLEIKNSVEAYIEKANLDLNKEIFMTKVIHKGHYSTIFKCKDNKRQAFTIKLLSSQCPKKGIHQSVILSVLNKSNNENCCIPEMMHTATVTGRYFFLSEYYPKTFKDAMRDNWRGFHIDLVQKLTKQLISAVYMLNANNIIHTDINERHVLLNFRCDTLKLCGFDRAGYSHNIKILPNSGTPRCRAPETILGFYPSYGIDVWATALIIFEMATSRKLFTGKYNNQILYTQLCTLQSFDYGILDECRYRHIHFNGTDFKKHFNNTKNFVPVSNFTGDNLLPIMLFESYDTKWRPQRESNRVLQEIKKMGKLCRLLQQMLMMDPRKRISIARAADSDFLQN